MNLDLQEMVFGTELRRSQNQAPPDKRGWNAFFILMDRSRPGDLDEQRRICTELQMQLWQDVPYIPMGEYWQSTAYRKDLVDVLPGCFAVFWGVRRA